MRLGAIHEQAEMSEAARQYAMAARSILATDGSAESATAYALAQHCSERVRSVLANRHRREDARAKLKAGVDALSTEEATALSDHSLLAGSFLRSLGTIGAFDRILPAMTPLPMRTRIVLVTQGVTAGSPGEGKAKRISRLTLGVEDYAEQKAVGVVVVSKELARLGDPLASRLFDTELRKGAASVADDLFIQTALEGLVGITPSGSTANALRFDLAQAFGDVDSDDNARFFIIMGSATAKSIAFLEGADDLLKDFTPTGGAIKGVPVVVTDSAGGRIIVVNASLFGGDRGTIEVSRSEQATVVLDDEEEDSPESTMVAKSMWQHNLVGLRAERLFGCTRLSNAAAAFIEDAPYMSVVE
jgi:hypothetical protein